jgi:hypothetical protein
MSDDLFSYGPKNIKEFLKENLMAILWTVIIHLVVIIILVFTKVDSLKKDHELGVMLDFTEEKSLEERLEEEMVEVPAEWLEQVYAAREKASNRAVNVNDEVQAQLSTDDYVQELWNELESQKDEEFLKDREKWEEIISSLVYDEEPLPEVNDAEEEEPFIGPTTITYEFLEPPLDRRKVIFTIPVYRCEGSALVVVDIVVTRNGSVSSATVSKNSAGYTTPCFIEAATEAALRSLFRSDFGAPDKQKARITYQFIAQ